MDILALSEKRLGVSDFEGYRPKLQEGLRSLAELNHMPHRFAVGEPLLCPRPPGAGEPRGVRDCRRAGHVYFTVYGELRYTATKYGIWTQQEARPALPPMRAR